MEEIVPERGDNLVGNKREEMEGKSGDGGPGWRVKRDGEMEMERGRGRQEERYWVKQRGREGGRVEGKEAGDVEEDKEKEGGEEKDENMIKKGRKRRMEDQRKESVQR